MNDLPEFYDPIESALYKDNLDSYSFTSTYNFMTSLDKRMKCGILDEGLTLLNKIMMVWLTRNLSEKLLSEVIYSILQFEFGEEVKEKELLSGRTDKLRELCERFFQCFGGEEEEKEAIDWLTYKYWF